MSLYPFLTLVFNYPKITNNLEEAFLKLSLALIFLSTVTDFPSEFESSSKFDKASTNIENKNAPTIAQIVNISLPKLVLGYLSP